MKEIAADVYRFGPRGLMPMNACFVGLAVLLVAQAALCQGATDGTEHGFLSRLRHRVYLGEYSSYFADDIRMAQVVTTACCRSSR